MDFERETDEGRSGGELMELLPTREQRNLRAIGLRPAAVIWVPVAKLHMQYRSELVIDHLLRDDAGVMDRSIVNSPLYKALRVFQAGGMRAVRRQFRELDYYRMFRCFDQVGYRFDWYNEPEKLPFKWDDDQIWTRLNKMIDVYKSIEQTGYLQGKFRSYYITVLEVPFEVSRHGRQFDWEPYEIWGGHHRAAALAALGLKEAEVILLKDERPRVQGETRIEAIG